MQRRVGQTLLEVRLAVSAKGTAPSWAPMRRITASPTVVAAFAIACYVLRPRSDELWREDVVSQLLLRSCELAQPGIHCADYAAGRLQAGKGPNAKVVWQCQQPWLEYSRATQSAYLLVRKSASMSIQHMLRQDVANPFNATPHEGKGGAMLPRAVAVYTFVREPLSHFAAGGLARAPRLDP